MFSEAKPKQSTSDLAASVRRARRTMERAQRQIERTRVMSDDLAMVLAVRRIREVNEYE